MVVVVFQTVKFLESLIAAWSVGINLLERLVVVYVAIRCDVARCDETQSVLCVYVQPRLPENDLARIWLLVLVKILKKHFFMTRMC